MLWFATIMLSLLTCLPATLSAPTEYPYGTIEMPLAGTAVLPGANFTFTYNPHADYGLSSFAFHVWLLTGEDPDEDFGNSFTSLITSNPSGYYFGRFDYPNYPAVPYAKNPPPPQLTMPDFSKSPGGFASGSAASNLTMRLVVIEEWGNSQPTVGRQLSVVSTSVVYNATIG